VIIFGFVLDLRLSALAIVGETNKLGAKIRPKLTIDKIPETTVRAKGKILFPADFLMWFVGLLFFG
jgi:hypothetical protein